MIHLHKVSQARPLPVLTALTVFLAGVIAGAALMASAGCAKQDAVSVGHPVFVARVISHGTSMVPTYADGEESALELCTYDDLRARDTVVYWHELTGQFVHHRLMFREDSGRWVTQGDNNATQDRGHMSSDQFIGRTKKLAAK